MLKLKTTKTTLDHNVRRQREIAAKWRVLELIDQLGEQQIETALGISRITIYRWKKQQVIPSQATMVALESLAGQTYHMLLSGMWKDWKIGEDGRLHGPGYKYGLHGGDILGLWYVRQMVHNYQRQIAYLKGQLAKAYAEIATFDAAANAREFDLGELPVKPSAPLPSPADRRRQFWLRVRRRQA